MRILSLVMAGAVLLASPSAAFAWGATGHRVTGAIADDNLSGVARAHVRLIRQRNAGAGLDLAR